MVLLPELKPCRGVAVLLAAQVCQAPAVMQQGSSSLRLRMSKLISQPPVRVVRVELPPAVEHPEELAELHPAGIPIPAHPEAQNPPEDQKALVARATPVVAPAAETVAAVTILVEDQVVALVALVALVGQAERAAAVAKAIAAVKAVAAEQATAAAKAAAAVLVVVVLVVVVLAVGPEAVRAVALAGEAAKEAVPVKAAVAGPQTAAAKAAAAEMVVPAAVKLA